MLSLQQAIEIRESIKSYLQATFTFRKRQVAQAFDDFIEHPTQGMFKGPFVSLKLRFVKAQKEEIDAIPFLIKPDWPPYDHQVKSWTRLSTENQNPRATIITTGTGSGKTESFLYPMLDYCFRQQHRPGIKVIILYPMNALATDQAKRLAEMIHEDPRLKGKIRAGLFIGEGNGPKGLFPKIMGADHIVEHRDSILDAPPDILLTNFKMLDYALMKHNFHRLWLHNLADPGLFRFLVLDELHTYDGAQGTDVANLIRRLKLKLSLPAEQLCAVGTSATIGSGPEAPTLLAEYASKVFGENIDTDAVITENRISTEEFFGAADALNDFIPLPNRLKDLIYQDSEGFPAFIQKNINVWQQEPEQLAKGLLQLKIVRDLVEVTNKGNGVKTLADLIRELSIVNESYRKLPQWDETYQYSPKERVLESLLTLISEAKDIDNPRSPFMYLQVQLWVRELSGVQYTLEEHPAFSFRDRVDALEEMNALPPWYCRECNSNGWLGVKLENGDSWVKDVNEIYEKYFNRNKNVYYLLPKATLSLHDFQATGYAPDDNLDVNIHPHTLKIIDNSETGIRLQALRKLRENKIEEICPCCNSAGTVAIVGTKIPTMSSIAISQTLATDLDKASDRERKVLAFTNSVQDAAHQAGFVEGRNYRFALRGAVQKVVNLQEGAIRLDELANIFIDYWKKNGDESGEQPLDGYLYRFYPKDYIGKSSPKDYVQGSSYASHFLKEFDERIRWEIYSEFGFSSKIGRTLEKTGASSVFFDPEKLQQAVDSLAEWLQNNDMSDTIQNEQLLRFSNLILHRMRSRGAVDHIFLSKFRKEKVEFKSLSWNYDSRHFLNQKFGSRSRLPKLLTNQSSRDNLLDTTQTKNSNWFHNYFTKSFPTAAVAMYFVNEFFEQWTQALLAAKILNVTHAGDLHNYAIEPSTIWVHKNIRKYQCDTCEDTQYTYDEPEVIAGGSCVSYRCTGHYEPVTSGKTNYYKEVYNRNRTPRVFAREHTGLLERGVRERLEIDFKQRPKFNSVNALVATSTLEMGIDIGDLNTAYNNSIPPLPANFLQRVGRAGRKTGSAVVVNFAKNQNHDLYYFTDPQEMMAGEVSTPGCYLEAKDILRRHFTAFCFDSWTATNPAENAIPTFVRDLKMHNADMLAPEFFINRVTKYIADNKLFLTTRFLVQYDARIKEYIFPEIDQALLSGSFFKELWDVFERIKQEIHAVEKRRKDIDDEVKVLNLAKGDPLLEEYAKEKKNLNGIKKSIAARNVLEHLTNVGILPNYAFPETGVTLNAHVIRPAAEGSTSLNPDKDFELVRSASQAIKEFAPENYFYTQGYRFEVSGVNTFDWVSHSDNFHQKRFCSKCDHVDQAALAAPGNCPKCGDPSWASSSNLHTFVKMTNVRSVNYADKATLTDHNDDRDRRQYQVMQHVNLDADSSAGAWVLKDIPFGIEFVRNVTISTINYGLSDANDARKIKINDTEALTKGFVTCKHCGKSISATHLVSEARDFHYGFCKDRDIRYVPGEQGVFEEIYFFREMKTEVLKIVLPIQEFNSETDIRMFQAGLELGLKKYFKGNPGHIHIQSYREFNQRTDKFDRFLLMYDTIPGGTGYLEQLFDHKEFTLLLQLSYAAVRDCACQLEGHDGCYKCIYSYGNQYNREDLSRERAEKWFAKIVEKTEQWEQHHHGLTSITNSGKIEESELEERFIKLLSVYADQTEGVEFKERKDSGTVYYELQIHKGDVEALYWIRPQVVLGPKDGIAYNTRTDFLIVCGQYQYKKKDFTDRLKKIAVYLDGYQYHASVEHNVFERDIAIRQSIAAQPEYRSWTLTWEDLNLFQKQLEGEVTNDELTKLFKANFAEHHSRLLRTVGNEEQINYALAANSVERLSGQLLKPQELFPASWFRYLGSWTENMLEPSFDPALIGQLLGGTLPGGNYIKDNRVKDFNALVPVSHGYAFDFCQWHILVNIGKAEVFHQLQLQSLDEINKEQWQFFWSLYNLYQSSDTIPTVEAVGPVETNEWENEVYEWYDARLHSLLKQSISAGWITADNAEFLDCWLNEKGEILADAELILAECKIAIAPLSLEAEKALRAGGFKIYSMEELDTIKL